MPIGILGSLGIVTLIYVAVALVITGLVPYRGLGGDVPIAEGFQGKRDAGRRIDHLRRSARATAKTT